MTTHDRSKHIGGSDIAAILGLSPWQSALDLYNRKKGLVIDEPDPDRDRRFRRGKLLEPVVREMIVHEYPGMKIQEKNARYMDWQAPYFSAEIDCELVDEHGEYCSGEIKTVSPFAAKAWGDAETDDIPAYYRAQVQWGLGILPEARRAYVFALFGADELRRYTIERNEDDIALIRGLAEEFWQRLEANEPPEPQTLADYKSKYKGGTGLQIEATPDIRATIEAIDEMRQSIKANKMVVETLEENLVKFVGDADEVTWEGRVLATYYPQTRKAYVSEVKATTYRKLVIRAQP
jgi:putative phage-type endonuclease